MAEFTENYELEKPLQTEYYDVDVFNANADKIDTALKNLADETTGRLMYDVTVENGDKKMSFCNINDASIKFYAPETSGDDGDFLTSRGYDKTPVWISRDEICEKLGIDVLDRSYNILIAAYNSSEAMKKAADYVCDDEDASEIFNSVFTSLKNGGRIYIAEGNYYFKGPLHLWESGITICGSGYKTVLDFECDDYGIEIRGNYNVFENMKFIFDGKTTSDYRSFIFFNTYTTGSGKCCIFRYVEINTNVYAFSDNIFSQFTGGSMLRILNCNIYSEEFDAFCFKKKDDKFACGNIINEVFSDSLNN